MPTATSARQRQVRLVLLVIVSCGLVTQVLVPGIRSFNHNDSSPVGVSSRQLYFGSRQPPNLPFNNRSVASSKAPPPASLSPPLETTRAISNSSQPGGGGGNNSSEWLFGTGTKNIFNRRSMFIINNPDLCSNLPSDKRTIISLMPSEAKNFQRRSIIRNDWVNNTNMPNSSYHIKHVFILGKSKSSQKDPTKWNEELELLRKENTIYSDIILADFVEDYFNLTYKTIAAITWANFYCPNAHFVLKIDDDVFVRREKLLATLDTYKPENVFGGKCMSQGKPHREKKSKWYISKTEYQRDRFPPFCFGPAYIFSSDLLPKLFQATLIVPFFKLEDVYMGLCLEKVGGEVKTIPGFENVAPKYTFCNFKDLSVVHGIEPAKWSMIQRDMERRLSSGTPIVCPKKKIAKKKTP